MFESDAAGQGDVGPKDAFELVDNRERVSITGDRVTSQILYYSKRPTM